MGLPLPIASRLSDLLELERCEKVILIRQQCNECRTLLSELNTNAASDSMSGVFIVDVEHQHVDSRANDFARIQPQICALDDGIRVVTKVPVVIELKDGMVSGVIRPVAECGHLLVNSPFLHRERGHR